MVVPLPASLWSDVVLPQLEALPFFLRAKRSSELRQPSGLKCFKLRQKQFKPEARTPSEGEGEVWRRSRHPEGETFSTENASTIRQFCYAKLPGGRSRREGDVSGFAKGK